MSDLTTDGIGALPAPRLPRPDQWFSHGLPVLDLVLAVAAGVGAEQVSAVGTSGVLLTRLMLAGFYAGLIYVLSMRMRGAYRLPSLVGRAERWRNTLVLAMCSGGLALSISTIGGTGRGIPARACLLFALLQVAGLAMSRLAARSAASALIRRNLVNGPSVIIVGDAEDVDRIDHAALLAHHGFSDTGRIRIGDAGLGDDTHIDAVLTLSRRCLAERIIVATSRASDRSDRLRSGLRRSALPVTLLCLDDALPLGQDRPEVGGAQLVELQSGAISSGTLRLKRCLDVLLATMALLLLCPLLLLTALLIKLDSRGPVVFRQRRHGFDRRPFFIYKFRSMTVVEDGPHVTQARRDDPRVTRIGRMIRRSSIDELPQLINVLRGDMSLVGPRPHAVAHDDAYTTIVERYALRHHVRPGLTGWAQINGARGETSAVHQMQRRIDLDLWYIDHFSIWLDLAILCRTCIELAKNDAF